MAKKTSKTNPTREAVEAGWALASKHVVLAHIARCASIQPAPLHKDAWAQIHITRYYYDRFVISYSENRKATPDQWAWVFAHCLLHTGLNHWDPATTGGLSLDAAHNAGACLVVNRLLKSLKVGTPPLPIEDFDGKDEVTLAKHWRATTVPEIHNLGGPQGDIQGEVLSRDSKSGRDDAQNLALGLSNAVSRMIDRAAGFDPEQAKTKQVWDHALGWFVSSYPLLGGLAAGFRIIADADIARSFDIAIAAIDDSLGEIYINPNCNYSQDEWRFILAHEMLHAGLRHSQRAMGRDPYLWNVSCDYVINGWLVEMGVGTLPDGVLFDLELSGLSAESVYDRIVNDARRIRKLATLRGRGLGDVLGEPLPLPREASGGVNLDEFYRRALSTGLSYHTSDGRGYLPAGLVDEIKVIDQPPIAWDVALARWFEQYVRSPEPMRSYGRASRRQASTPEIPRPGRYYPQSPTPQCTFGVVLDTSGSMSGELLGKALGTIAAYARAKEVEAARVIYCDAAPHDAGYVKVEDIVDRVKVTGRGGTVLQPAIRFLERTEDFPKDGPILIITDGECDVLTVSRPCAYLIPAAAALPFATTGPVFRVV